MFYRSMTFDVSADLVDDDAIKETVSTSTDPVVYSGSDLNGDMVGDDDVARALIGGFSGVASVPTVTTSSETGAYEAGSAVVFVGLFNGAVVERTALLVAANGGETVRADGLLETVTEVRVEAQASTAGALQFGWSGVGPMRGATGRAKTWLIVAVGSGNLHVEYGSGAEDTVPMVAGQEHRASPSFIFGDSTADISIYESY